MRTFSVVASILIASSTAAAEPSKKSDAPEPQPPSRLWVHEELRRFKADEAKQGVAADDEYLYVISNTAIGKYRKSTGERVGGWKQPKGGPLSHLNAGIVRDGKLYCAHSNFPTIPSTSSVEIFDPDSMEHTGNVSLGIAPGSLTWVDRRDDQWFACFAHYSKDRPRTGRGPESTEVVRYDLEWRRTESWVFPPAVIEVFGGSSCSGGAFGPGGALFVTGHDAKTLFVMEFPKAGAILRLADRIPISAEGQAFCWDPEDSNILYSLVRSTSEVVVSRVTRK
jgi:hypothetical protein